MTIWTPRITGRAGPRYLAIAERIAESIASGDLADGARLPPQRDLAHALGLSLSTVTRAYAEAERRGLVYGEVGRGTYVGGSGPADISMLFHPRTDGGMIDMTMNLPAPGDGSAILARTLTRLSQSAALETILDYRSIGDGDAHAEAGAAWIGRLGLEIPGSEVVLTIGAQHGIMVSLMATSRPGDLILAECLSYPPLKQIAQRLNLKLHPVDMDGHGLLPEALDTACRTTPARVLYCMPTLHSPTAATIPDDRRRQIAKVARRHDLTIIEDDVFGFLPEARPLPLSAIAPERSLLVTSVSKSLAPWLRVGYVRAPDNVRDAIRAAVHMSCGMQPPLMAEIARQWISDGTADRMSAWQREEAKARQAIARRILGRFPYHADPFGLHVWLPLPEPWRTEPFRMEAERRGVKVLSGDIFAVGKTPAPQAIRLALGREAGQERVIAGLKIVAGLLGGRESPGLSVV